jgi:hypothetical protein
MKGTQLGAEWGMKTKKQFPDRKEHSLGYNIQDHMYIQAWC